ncbi:ATP-dependent DNA ligase [Naasia aerilata]|uniref:DUF7882 domain-containing protein n=1 Tax=Naasia aerilata TaxID=1162966 RepID=A0ABM8G8D6_9MICO|nr:ATP-dependent DNA ligase [Naasia aerilata]BDZ44371.1 hypothetical protein GCM10025866_02800 [Naasia aerilata]
MGKLHYGDALVVEFEDRLLAHLQIAIGVKLRRNESFHFAWRDEQSVGGGRSTIWMHPAVPLRFHYRSRALPSLNLHWVDGLIGTANTAAGLRIIPEPKEEQAERK